MDEFGTRGIFGFFRKHPFLSEECEFFSCFSAARHSIFVCLFHNVALCQIGKNSEKYHAPNIADLMNSVQQKVL